MEDNSVSNTDKQLNLDIEQLNTENSSELSISNNSINQNINSDPSTAVVTPIKLTGDTSLPNDCVNNTENKSKKITSSQNCKKSNAPTTSIKPLILPAPISESIYNTTKLPVMSSVGSSIVSSSNVPSSVSTATFSQQPQQPGPQVIATIQPQQFGYQNLQNNRYSMMPMSIANNYNNTSAQSTITFNNTPGLGHTVQLMPVLNHNNTQLNPPRMQSLPLFMTPIIGSPGGMLFPPNMTLMPPVSSALPSSFLSQSNFSNVSSSLSSLASHNHSSISAAPINIQQQQPIITTPFPLSDQFQQQHQHQTQSHYQTHPQQINIINSATQIPQQAHTVLPTSNIINTIPTKDVHNYINSNNNNTNLKNDSLNKNNSINNNTTVNNNNVENKIKDCNNDNNSSLTRQNSIVNIKHREHIRTQIYRMKKDDEIVTESHTNTNTVTSENNENNGKLQVKESLKITEDCNDKIVTSENVNLQPVKDISTTLSEDNRSISSSSCQPDVTSTTVNIACLSTVAEDDKCADKITNNPDNNTITEDNLSISTSLPSTTPTAIKSINATPPSATIPPTKRARLPSPEILNESPVVWRDQQQQQQPSFVDNLNSYKTKSPSKPLSNTDSLFDKMKNETTTNMTQFAFNKSPITKTVNPTIVHQKPPPPSSGQTTKQDGSQLKRKTAIVRPEQRKILVHYLDDLIIFESDEPFPTTNKTQVVKSALKSGTIRLDDTSSCGSGSRKSTLHPHTSSSLSSSSKLFLSDSYLYTTASNNSSLEDNEDDTSNTTTTAVVPASAGGGKIRTAIGDHNNTATLHDSPLSPSSPAIAKHSSKHHNHHRHQKKRNNRHHHHNHKSKKSMSSSSSPSSSSIIKSPNQIAPLTVDIPINGNNQPGEDSVDSSQFRPLSRCSEMSPLVASPRKQSVHLSPKKQQTTPQQPPVTPPPPPIKLVSPVPQQQQSSQQPFSPPPITPNNQVTPCPTSSSNYNNIPIQQWSVQDVSDFVRQTPGCEAYHGLFSGNEIDGEALLLLSKDNLIQGALNMKIGPALKLCSRLDRKKKSDDAAGLS